MEALWNGILFGLLLAVFIGPVFFALIQTSLYKGILPGMAMAVGISLSDIVYITITYLGISRLSNNAAIHFWLGLSGGMIMIAFGISSMVKPLVRHAVSRTPDHSEAIVRHISKGFLLNGLNPSVLIFWIGISSMATVSYRFSQSEVFLFFLSIISTVFVTDLIKIFVADLLRKMLTNRFMKIMNQLVGLGLIVFGIRLLYYALEGKIFHV